MQASILVPVANQDQLGGLWQKDLAKMVRMMGGSPMVQLGTWGGIQQLCAK